MKKNNIMKKLVVLTLAVVMALSMIPATTEAASTNSSVYRKAKANQKKVTNAAEYYGYYTEVSLSSNSSTKVVWNLKYTNTRNEYFKFTQVTTKKNGRIKTTYKKGGKTYTYNGVLKSLAKYKTQDGYVWQEKSAILADPIIEEAEKDGWTLSDFKYPVSSTKGSTSFKATNKAGKAYRIVVSRVAVKKTKSVKTVYTCNDQTTTKDVIIASLKKYA